MNIVKRKFTIINEYIRRGQFVDEGIKEVVSIDIGLNKNIIKSN